MWQLLTLELRLKLRGCLRTSGSEGDDVKYSCSTCKRVTRCAVTAVKHVTRYFLHEEASTEYCTSYFANSKNTARDLADFMQEIGVERPIQTVPLAQEFTLVAQEAGEVTLRQLVRIDDMTCSIEQQAALKRILEAGFEIDDVGTIQFGVVGAFGTAVQSAGLLQQSIHQSGLPGHVSRTTRVVDYE